MLTSQAWQQEVNGSQNSINVISCYFIAKGVASFVLPMVHLNFYSYKHTHTHKTANIYRTPAWILKILQVSVVPILLMRKLRLREVMRFCLRWPASEWGGLTPEHVTFASATGQMQRDVSKLFLPSPLHPCTCPLFHEHLLFWALAVITLRTGKRRGMLPGSLGALWVGKGEVCCGCSELPPNPASARPVPPFICHDLGNKSDAK